MVLTQQKDTAKYLASGEAVFRTTESQLFNNLTTTTIARTAAPSYPADLTVTNPNDTVFKVNGNVGGHKMGPSLLLKVMSGDKIDLSVQSFYNSGTTSSPNSSVTDVLASFASGIVNMASGGKGSMTDLNNTTTSPIYAAINSFMTNDPNQSTKPKAYLNWILLDDQLKYVGSYPQSGAVVVGTAGVLNTLGYTGIPITKNGFLYVWVSNETPNWDAFFDNLKVVHYAGPELEETHYYPFGLAMAGISSKALKPFYAENKYRYNGKELQNKEFSDGAGLENYDYGWRLYDPQIARFSILDAYAEKYDYLTPYHYTDNNPLNSTDESGDSIFVHYDTKNALDFWEAIGTLLQTEDGKKLWNEYAGSTEHDVYIGMNSFDQQKDEDGASDGVSATKRNVSITNGKIDFSLESKETKNNFSSFDNHDVSRSDGRSVSLISLNKKYWTGEKKLDKFDLAESIYHEFYAHLKSSAKNGYEQHKEYGNFYSGLQLYYPKVTHSDTSGSWPVEVTDQKEWTVPKGSPYYRIREQLLQIKNVKKGK
jgi:RHS repeat-associated protein